MVFRGVPAAGERDSVARLARALKFCDKLVQLRKRGGCESVQKDLDRE